MRQRWMKGITALIFGLVFTAGVMPARAATIAKPGNFKATITKGATTDSANLTWTATGTITNFTIQTADFTAGKSAVTVAGTARSYVFSGLKKGERYYYRIRANTAAGSSAFTQALEVMAP